MNDPTFEFEIQCPVCGDQLTHMTSVTGADIPKPGDVTICATCVTLLEFDDDLSPHPGNLEVLPQDEKDLVVAAIAHIQQNRSTLH